MDTSGVSEKGKELEEAVFRAVKTLVEERYGLDIGDLKRSIDEVNRLVHSISASVNTLVARVDEIDKRLTALTARDTYNKG